MSSDTTSPQIIPTPPPGTIWVAEIGPALNFIMIGATFGSVLVAMLLALFFFSTPTLRKKPIFILNVLSLLLGIAGAITNVYEEFRTLLFPDVPLNPHVIIAMGAFEGLTPSLVDSILLLRLYAAYPYNRTPLPKFLVVMGVPIVVKLARIANAAIYLENYSRTIQASTGVGGADIIVTSRLPCVKIEWSLQVFDDVWSSVIFLIRVYKRGAFREFDTVSQRLKSLFWIATSNFVFPLMLGVLQLAIYLARPQDFLIALYIESVNFHFTIIGVVFATIWMAEGRWAHDRHAWFDDTSNPSTIEATGRHIRRIKTGITFAQSDNISISRCTEEHPSMTSHTGDNNIYKVQPSALEYELPERKQDIDHAL